jgi:hypothetical protein
VSVNVWSLAGYGAVTRVLVLPAVTGIRPINHVTSACRVVAERNIKRLNAPSLPWCYEAKNFGTRVEPLPLVVSPCPVGRKKDQEEANYLVHIEN